MGGAGSQGPLLGGGWPGLLPELPPPTGPPPAASLEAVVALVAARVAPLRPDLQRALERDLQLLPPGGGDGGLEWLAGVAGSHRRRVRVRAGRLARAVGAPLVLRRAVGMLPALRALDDQASARLLVLAGLGEGRACARTVRALMLLFGVPLHPALPAGPVPATVAGGWVGLLRQVRSRGVVVLRQDVAAAGAWWLAESDVAVVGRLLAQGRDAASQIVGPVRCQLQACGALPITELLLGLRRLGPARPVLTGRQLACGSAASQGCTSRAAWCTKPGRCGWPGPRRCCAAASPTQWTASLVGCWSAGCRRRTTPRAAPSTSWWSVRGCARPAGAGTAWPAARATTQQWRSRGRRRLEDHVRSGASGWLRGRLGRRAPPLSCGRLSDEHRRARRQRGGTVGATGCCRASQPRNSAHTSSNPPVTGTPGRSQPWWRRACQSSSHTPTPRSPAVSSGSSTEGRPARFDRSYPSFTRDLRRHRARPHCEPCSASNGRDHTVIEHPPGEEIQWDWLELPDPPAHWHCGDLAHLLVGSLPSSGKWRAVLADIEDQRHLIEALHAVSGRLGGVPKQWRFDRMATVVSPNTGRVGASFAAVAKHYGVQLKLCPAAFTCRSADMRDNNCGKRQGRARRSAPSSASSSQRVARDRGVYEILFVPRPGSPPRGPGPSPCRCFRASLAPAVL